MAWLKSVMPTLSAHEQLALESDWRQLDAGGSRKSCSLIRSWQAPPMRSSRQLLMTLPGVNYAVALGLLAALGDISRFRDGDHAASYLGLVPSTRQSGNQCYHGHITKAGNWPARWLLTQAAQHVARHPGPLGAFFRRLAKRKNRNVAIIAMARKLVLVAFLMLKNNEPYRYARPELMREKFSRLGETATGKRSPVLTEQTQGGIGRGLCRRQTPRGEAPANYRAASVVCSRIGS